MNVWSPQASHARSSLPQDDLCGTKHDQSVTDLLKESEDHLAHFHGLERKT